MYIDGRWLSLGSTYTRRLGVRVLARVNYFRCIFFSRLVGNSNTHIIADFIEIFILEVVDRHLLLGIFNLSVRLLGDVKKSLGIK